MSYERCQITCAVSLRQVAFFMLWITGSLYPAGMNSPPVILNIHTCLTPFIATAVPAMNVRFTGKGR